MSLSFLEKLKGQGKPVSKRSPARTPSVPILGYTWLLTIAVIVVLLLLIGVFLIAADSYRRLHTDSAAWLLFAVLGVILGVVVPLFWGSQIGLAFDLRGLRVGNGVNSSVERKEKADIPAAQHDRPQDSTHTKSRDDLPNTRKRVPRKKTGKETSGLHRD